MPIAPIPDNGRRPRIVIIGGGIVGLATAWRLSQRRPEAELTVLEKEPGLARHQTGRNSGVIHSGIYYKPGSLKATNCRRGKAMLEAFCSEHGIAWERCGKVIVAVDEAEAARLDGLLERGLANGVECEMIGAERLRELEPHVAGVRAIHVPEAGIVDYTAVCAKLAELLAAAGGRVVTGARVVGIDRRGGVSVVRVRRTGGGATPGVPGTADVHGGEVEHRAAGGDDAFEADLVVNCAGLYSDRVTSMAGDRPSARIVPFRGEYFTLRPSARRLVNNLIYPAPDPSFPFLGVHFTRMIHRDEHGPEIECGPNAVLAFAREGYTNTTIRPRELAWTLGMPSFWRLAARHWRTGLGELWRSYRKPAFVSALQRLIPEIRGEDIEPAPAGVRAQALGPGGRLLDDFSIVEAEGAVHVCNAPSPAATSSLAIGEHVAGVIAPTGAAEGGGSQTPALGPAGEPAGPQAREPTGAGAEV